MNRPRVWCLTGPLLLLAACGDRPRPATDSATAVAPDSAVVAAVSPSTGWEDSVAGPIMLLGMQDNSAGALVVLPQMTDSMLVASGPGEISLENTAVELFGRGGLAGSTSLMESAGESPDGCVAWPRMRLAEVPAEPWRVGFIRGTVIPVSLDSLESMTASDSAAVTREIARIASAVAEGDDPAFRGLPFTVRKAYRFGAGTGTAIVADVIRKISEEADPRQENILLVAERAQSSGAYEEKFHTRVAGAEEAVRTTEVLAAVRFAGSRRPAVVVSFDYESGSRVALLQRMSERAWRLTWRSAYTGC